MPAVNGLHLICHFQENFLGKTSFLGYEIALTPCRTMEPWGRSHHPSGPGKQGLEVCTSQREVVEQPEKEALRVELVSSFCPFCIWISLSFPVTF